MNLLLTHGVRADAVVEGQPRSAIDTPRRQLFMGPTMFADTHNRVGAATADLWMTSFIGTVQR